MTEVSKAKAFEVWSLLESRTTYRIEQDQVATRRTAQRLKRAMEGFKGHESLCKIAAGTGWTVTRCAMLQGWWEEWKATQHPAPVRHENTAREIVGEAMRSHLDAIIAVGRRLQEDLQSLTQNWHPVRYINLSSFRYLPTVSFRAELWNDGRVRLFEPFRRHVDNQKLWEAFDDLKGALVAEVARAFAEQDTGGMGVLQDVGEPTSGIFITVPGSYARKLERGHWRVDIDFGPNLPPSFDVAQEELAKVLHMDIQGGQCDLCKGAT